MKAGSSQPTRPKLKMSSLPGPNDTLVAQASEIIEVIPKKTDRVGNKTRPPSIAARLSASATPMKPATPLNDERASSNGHCSGSRDDDGRSCAAEGDGSGLKEDQVLDLVSPKVDEGDKDEDARKSEDEDADKPEHADGSVSLSDVGQEDTLNRAKSAMAEDDMTASVAPSMAHNTPCDTDGSLSTPPPSNGESIGDIWMNDTDSEADFEGKARQKTLQVSTTRRD